MKRVVGATRIDSKRNEVIRKELDIKSSKEIIEEAELIWTFSKDGDKLKTAGMRNILKKKQKKIF